MYNYCDKYTKPIKMIFLQNILSNFYGVYRNKIKKNIKKKNT